MSVSHTRDMNPRIRILSCDTPEPARRKLEWRLPAAVAAVAGLGVGITLVVTSVQQPAAVVISPEAAPIAPAPAENVAVMASADAATFRPTRQIQRSVRYAVSADLRAAAKAARQPAVYNASTSTAATSTASAGSVPSSTQSQGTQPSTPRQTASGTVSEPTSPKSASGPSAVGPEQAPGAGDPISPQ